MLEVLREGARIFSRNIDVRMHGLKRYKGDDEQICRKIIDGCYNKEKEFFMASAGNYRSFYSRDFGWCIEGLLNLGYKAEVDNTLRYVMGIYAEKKDITVAINDKGKAFNFPNVYSPDSVAYLYRSLRISKSRKLIIKYSRFLNEQLITFESEVLDKKGMVKDRRYSGMRDHVKTRSSCYDMIMACMLCDEVDRINKFMGKGYIMNVLKKYGLKKNLLKYYWNGRYFMDGLHDSYCSGHSNTYPYYLDVISDKKMLKRSIRSIIEHGLDKPFPLTYGYSKNTKFIWQEIFVNGWEKDTSWAMLGLAYIDILSRIDKTSARRHLKKYKDNISRSKCFIEVYSDNDYYRSLFFASDDSMLWASMYLDLKKRLKP